MLLGNPHLRWQQLYWEAHVKVPGRLDFYGSTLVGYPWLRAGFNDRLGYVQTNNDSDNRDIFALPLDPARPDHYLFEGKPRPLRRVDVARRGEAERRVHGDRTPHVLALPPRADRLPELGHGIRLPIDGGRRVAVVRGVLAPEPRAIAEGLHEGDVDAVLARVELHVRGRRRQHPLPVELADAEARAGRHKLRPRRARRHEQVRVDAAASDAGPAADAEPAGRVHPECQQPAVVRHAAAAAGPGALSRVLRARRTGAAAAAGAGDGRGAREVLGRGSEAPEVRHAPPAGRAREAGAASRPSRRRRRRPAELAEARRVLEAWDNRASATSRGAVLFQRFWDTYRAEVAPAVRRKPGMRRGPPRLRAGLRTRMRRSGTWPRP